MRHRGSSNVNKHNIHFFRRIKLVKISTYISYPSTNTNMSTNYR